MGVSGVVFDLKIGVSPLVQLDYKVVLTREFLSAFCMGERLLINDLENCFLKF